MANMWLMGDELMGEGNVKAVLLRLATSRKVECSISDGVFGIVHWHKTFGRTMSLVATEPLTEMGNRNISYK